MILKPGQLPACPNNDRIMIQPDHVKEETETGLIIPEIAQKRANFGTIIHGGLKARDMLHDNGHQIGDHVWFGQFAGVWEEWDHITKLGDIGNCKHEDWSRAPSPGDRMQAFTCSRCGAYRLKEPVLIMNVEDILANESLERRIESGDSGILPGKTADGVTQHFIARRTDSPINSTEKRHAV